MKFDWRNLFFISKYRWNKGYDFNIFVFYIDLLIWTIPMSVIYVKFLISIFQK